MNAVEIEEAISALAERPFDAAEFPYLFLQAFGNKETTLNRLRRGESNKSDLGDFGVKGFRGAPGASIEAYESGSRRIGSHDRWQRRGTWQGRAEIPATRKTLWRPGPAGD